MAVLPYKNSGSSKKEQVAGMFDNISNKYDFLNHTLSFNFDKIWRRKAIKLLKPYKPQSILDVATGTADFAISACKLNPEKITGIDISEGMLEIGRQKILKKKLNQLIDLQLADSENLPFDDNNFDASIAGFGVRNFEYLEKGLTEVLRVLKTGAPFLILEFSKPQKTPFKQIYRFYFRKILPMIGRLISKDRSAYSYLPESVDEFPSGKEFIKVLEKVGFVNTSYVSLTFRVATIYIGEKPKSLL